ncbi:hypothetical protein [Streptomyces sp. Midd1]|uniref:hypothetical protein n=1 Tax=Streptomyces sp. Midd3 TaxID=3161191 RepID=UPI0034DADBFE
MTGEIAAYPPGHQLYEGFVRQGFTPGQPVIYMFNPHASVNDLKEAQYGSTRSTRKCLDFELGDSTISVTVETVTARYVDDDEAVHPDWYFEGAAIKSGFNPIPAGSRVRVYFVSVYSPDLNDGYIQLISDPHPDLNAAFRYTEEP